MGFGQLSEVAKEVISKPENNELSFYSDSEREGGIELPLTDSTIIDENPFPQNGEMYSDSDREYSGEPQWSEENGGIGDNSLEGWEKESLNSDEIESDVSDKEGQQDTDEPDSGEQNSENQNDDSEAGQGDTSNDVAVETNENDNSSESKENDEEKELSEDEINEKQKAAIKDALERIRNGEKLTNEELGNLGEMMMDQYYISKGYTPLNKHRVTSLDDKKGGFKIGIDGVYQKTNPDGSKYYVIADAKYNTSQLSDTNDGKQMSDNWIDKRLDAAVGKEKADEIRDAAEDDPDSVSHEVYHIDPNEDENGYMHTDIQGVDSDGIKTGEKTIVEYFDEDGNRIDPSEEN